MSEPPRVKLHSKRLADEHVGAGWQVTLEFRVAGDDEPYEIILVWPGPGEPVDPESGWGGPAGQAEPNAKPDPGRR